MPGNENEGRWQTTQWAMEYIWRLMNTRVAGKSHANAYEGFLCELFLIIPSESWVLSAVEELLTWGSSLPISVDIKMALIANISSGRILYMPTMNWARAVSPLPHLCHYLPGFRLRELPGHLLLRVLPVMQQLQREPVESLRSAKRWMDDNITDDEVIDNHKARMVAGARGAFASVSPFSCRIPCPCSLPSTKGPVTVIVSRISFP